MTDIDKDIVSELNKKIDYQARFTRIVTALCCLSVIACMFYALTSMISVMPDLLLAKVLSNVENIHTEWQAIDRIESRKAKVK